MPELSVSGPFDECDLNHNFRLHPMRSNARQAGGLRKRRVRDLDGGEPPAQCQQQLRVEPCPDLSREYEGVVFEIPDQQRAQALTSTLWIGESAHHEFL